jgi:hypothetical protein
LALLKICIFSSTTPYEYFYSYDLESNAQFLPPLSSLTDALPWCNRSATASDDVAEDDEEEEVDGDELVGFDDGEEVVVVVAAVVVVGDVICCFCHFDAAVVVVVVVGGDFGEYRTPLDDVSAGALSLPENNYGIKRLDNSDSNIVIVFKEYLDDRQNLNIYPTAKKFRQNKSIYIFVRIKCAFCLVTLIDDVNLLFNVNNLLLLPMIEIVIMIRFECIILSPRILEIYYHPRLKWSIFTIITALLFMKNIGWS